MPVRMLIVMVVMVVNGHTGNNGLDDQKQGRSGTMDKANHGGNYAQPVGFFSIIIKV